MTVDFSSLKLYAVKVIYNNPPLPAERRPPMRSMVSVLGSSYSFTKVRFAGRYYRGQMREWSGCNR